MRMMRIQIFQQTVVRNGYDQLVFRRHIVLFLQYQITCYSRAAGPPRMAEASVPGCSVRYFCQRLLAYGPTLLTYSLAKERRKGETSLSRTYSRRRSVITLISGSHRRSVG